MKKLLVLAFGAIVVAGCSSTTPDTQQKPAEPAAPQLRTGLSAFQRMYGAARMWAPDAQPVRLQSQTIKGINDTDGKAAVWRAVFASPSKGSLKPFLWSGANSDDAPSPGVSPGNEDTYNPRNVSTKIVQPAAMRNDSDHAFEVAQEHGGKALLAKNPGLPVQYELSGDADRGQLTWFVSYGENLNQPRLKVAVDCASGNFIKVVK